VMVDLPTMKDRFEILNIHAKGKPIATDVDLEQIARGTPGFSGADLANLLNEAALLAAREEKKQISDEDISKARDKVLMGLESNLVLTKEDKELLAYHEAGHAVVGALLPHTDPVYKVTIVPRGRAMGVTQQIPERDRYLYTKDFMLDQMSVLMAGRAAEELVMNTTTSGAADDLKRATHLARKMVLEWGMSENLGRVSLSDENQEIFLGDEIARSRNFSERTAREIDEEIRSIIDEAYQRARKILEDNKSGLDRVVDELIEKEEISGYELLNLLQVEKQVACTPTTG
jgi:cell division protease FtsH